MNHFAATVFSAICLVGATASSPSGAVETTQPAVDWARDVYLREIKRHADRAGINEAEFLALLTPDLRKLWLAGRNAINPNVLDGPVLNAFFGWGVLPGHQVEFVRVSELPPGSGTIAVDLIVRHSPHRFKVELTPADGSWLIKNISYGVGEDFVSFRRRLAGAEKPQGSARE